MKSLWALILLGGLVAGGWYLTGGADGTAIGRRIAHVVAEFVPDQHALDEFNATKQGTYINQCAGVTGSVDWSIGVPSGVSNPNVRLIDAKLKKDDGKHVIVQFLYNVNTKVAKMSYAGVSGTPSTFTDELATLIVFCGLQMPDAPAGADDSSNAEGSQ